MMSYYLYGHRYTYIYHFDSVITLIMHLSAVIPFRELLLFLIEYYTEDNFINAVQAFRIILLVLVGYATNYTNNL